MVCQAASQTRFRALKYENGIAGSATIVVRVIACFQPLQDCQAEYFRHLLKPHSTSGDCSGWMGEGCGSWFPQQQFDWQSPNFNSLAAPHPLVQQNTNPQFINPGTNMVATTGALPVNANPGLSHLRVGQVNEPRGWFYCLPHFHQVFAPASNTQLKEQLPANPYEHHRENIIPKAGAGCAQKRFLVFDQSGDQTTMIFSSAFGTPIKCLTSWGPKSPGACNFKGEDPISKANLNLQSGPISTDLFDDKGTDVQSEMHEDTEELNALLYSDDDSDYTEDEEVTSTGHSPSTMTAHDEQFEGGTEEVASSTGPTKKRKLIDGGNDYVPLLVDIASSINPNRCSEYEDDADSGCAFGQNLGFGDMDLSSGNKRMRKEKIRETVSVLRSIIPGGEGKDAIAVLDEAIDYLKSLKLKAKAFGLSTL
ncbi:transcription factor bHLH145 [Herrania umbratica]|uniref:Transcription factor bHLH145 n=1 Tax=Herrania umbratica TaxID=108875 RepID=A0A6J1ACJ7_9ROSI|nr:transcription factor bHLH145 [Herrania umbratica]